MFLPFRLDRLRHHLVPLYNFDPQEAEDWEAELLDDCTIYMHIVMWCVSTISDWTDCSIISCLYNFDIQEVEDWEAE